LTDEPRRLALYLHMPFCETKCAYCDFNSYAGLESLIPDYTRGLCHELELWSAALPRDRAGTVFFGGGTPSLTPLAEMAAIVDAICRTFAPAEDVEMSLEANPGTVDLRYLRGLRELGFNRLSLGVQSFQDRELKALDRIHTGAEAADAFTAARAAGFANVNLDLIFGLNGQALAGWRANVERALSLRPEHLSLYALTVEDGTALASAISRGLQPDPDPDLQADMYELARDLAAQAGYLQYEISNWALPGFACRHNLEYWRNGRWLGLGAGAHSSLDGARFANARAPRGYLNRITGNERPDGLHSSSAMTGVLDAMPQVVWRETVDDEAARSDTAILGLRLTEGISLREFSARHGVDFLNLYGDAVTECRGHGLLLLEDGRLRLSERGLLLANEVLVRLLPRGGSAAPR